MTEQQIPVLTARLVEHQSAFNVLSTDDAQWVIQNTKYAIAIFIEAIKNRSGIVEPLLEFIGTVEIPATTKMFVARNKFVQNTDKKARVKISYLGDNFPWQFLSKVEKSLVGGMLRYGTLRKSSVDSPIIAELGGEQKAETTLAEIFALMEWQGNGRSGPLLINGYANIFYIRDINGVLWAVRCYWVGGGWDVNARSVKRPDGWFDGCRVFSRNSSETQS